LDRLEAEIGSLRIDADAGAADDLEIDAVLQFAQRMLLNPVEFWRTASLDQRQRFQRVLCPEGIAVSGQGIVGTPVTSRIFNLLQTISTDKTSLESLTISSWNQIISWLRQIDDLRQIATKLPKAA
jgi:hypothetical protein